MTQGSTNGKHPQDLLRKTGGAWPTKDLAGVRGKKTGWETLSVLIQGAFLKPGISLF